MSTIYPTVQGPVGNPQDLTISIADYSDSSAGTYISTSASSSSGWMYPNDINSSLTVSGDANFEGDVLVKGRSLTEMMSKIEDRLAILTPDPVKLAKFDALKKAYDNYKMLEALCQVENDDPDSI